jgi:sigma-B regulation protein RsbQ
MTETSALERHRVTIFGRPSRPTVLLLHGYGCDQTMWRRLVPHLDGEFRIVTYDQSGAGSSDPETYDPEKHGSLEGYADDLLAICEELDLDEVVVVGHSISAMIGVLAHLRAPHLVVGLVMIGPSPRFIDDGPYVGGFTRGEVEEMLGSLSADFDDWARTMAPAFMGRPDRPELARELVDAMLRTNPEAAEDFARLTFLVDNRAELPAVQCPTLVLQATDDPFVPDVVAEYVRDRIPDSTIARVEASGHFAHVSAPEETARAILTFLGPVRSFLRRVHG